MLCVYFLSAPDPHAAKLTPAGTYFSQYTHTHTHTAQHSVASLLTTNTHHMPSMLSFFVRQEAALQSHAAVDKTGRPPINPGTYASCPSACSCSRVQPSFHRAACPAVCAVIGASLGEGAVFPAVIGPITPVTFARAYDVDDVAAVAGELGMDLGGSDGERMAQQMVGRALLRFSEKSRAFVKGTWVAGRERGGAHTERAAKSRWCLTIVWASPLCVFVRPSTDKGLFLPT